MFTDLQEKKKLYESLTLQAAARDGIPVESRNKSNYKATVRKQKLEVQTRFDAYISFVSSKVCDYSKDTAKI